jgi:methyl-accepting chemotaxis protein
MLSRDTGCDIFSFVIIGFAVVSDEIGKLADQTSSSVKNISALIKKSENEVNKGMVNVSDTVFVIREIIICPEA